MTALTSSKRRRFGNLLGSKTSTEQPVVNGSDQSSQPIAPLPQDKASSNRAEIVPIDNHGQVSGVDEDRNLALNESTGQNVDDDTGEMLSVTTTTTTTTTTETRSSRSPQPPTNGEEVTAESYVLRQPPPQTLLDPSSAGRPSNGQHIPSEHEAEPAHSTVPEAASPKSAMENLKSAAVGLQDTRDVLRRSFHQETTPLPRRNPARKGRTQDIPPVPPIPQDQSWREPHLDDAAVEVEGDRFRKRKSLSSLPAPFSPESNGDIQRGKNPRLFKRAKSRQNAG